VRDSRRRGKWRARTRAGKGNAGTMGAPAGDLYLSVEVKPHVFFERRGNDLYTKIPLRFRSDARCKIEVPTIDGRSLVRIPRERIVARPALERKRRAERAEWRTRRPICGNSGRGAAADGRARPQSDEELESVAPEDPRKDLFGKAGVEEKKSSVVSQQSSVATDMARWISLLRTDN